MTKKGFSAGQVFIYLMTLIVFAVILTFGYRAIFTVTCEADKVSCVRFDNSIAARIKSVSGQFKSVRVYDFPLPTNVNKVCFVDLSTPWGTSGGSLRPVKDAAGICGGANDDSILCDAWKDNTTNIHLYSAETGCQPCDNMNVRELRLVEGSVCMKSTAGRVSLRITGQGDSAVVEAGQ